MKFEQIKVYAQLKNYKEVYFLYRSRAFQLAACLFLLVCALTFRLYDLQVLNHSELQKKSDKNRFSLVPILPYRGRVFDRNGELLADNQALYCLRLDSLVSSQKRQKIIEALSKKIGFNDEQAEKYFRKQKLYTHRQQSIPFAIINEHQAAQYTNISFEYPEVSLDYQISRIYPYRNVGVHLLGYVGLVDDADTNDPKLFSDADRNVRVSHVGKSGIERSYDRILRGKLGYKIIEVNANGRKIRDVSVSPAQDGADLQLTIDIRLQQYIDSKIEKLKASVVLMNVSNGGILAMSSAPYYDNNVFTSGKGIEELIQDKNKPFLNRSIQALYPPASIVKPFIALAGLHYGVLDSEKRFFGSAYYTLEGNDRRFHDWKKGGHGWINMNQAIAKSSDVYFYDLGYRIGIDRMHSYLSQFSFGDKTGIDIPGESSGLLPSREWKYAHNGRKWIPGETIITSVGQGYFLTTPLQLVTAMSTLANNGDFVSPFIVGFHAKQKKIENFHRVQWHNERQWNEVRLALYNTVKRAYGTAYKVMGNTSYSLAGKTGTAQVVNLVQDPDKRELQKENLEEKFRDHSLFSAYAPYKKPKVAIVVVVENGGNGSGIASELTKDILDKYFQYY